MKTWENATDLVGRALIAAIRTRPIRFVVFSKVFIVRSSLVQLKVFA
jgi:hypothetical protein